MVAATSYPVVWSEPGEEPVTGRLTAAPDALRLEGAAAGRLVTETIAVGGLAGVRIGRASGERLRGRATLVLERREGSDLLVQPLGPGLLAELADMLAELCSASERVDRVAVVLPLKPDALERARELIAEGPPFDPADKSLAQHEVFVTGSEAIFVFTGTDACESVRAIMRDTAVWPAAERWGACLADRPRLAEAGFAWRAPG